MAGRRPGRGDETAAAYRHCWQIASAHYENFTLGSWFLPRALRRHIAAIYAFARTADDIADEGDLEPASRLARLRRWEHQLEDCYRGRAHDPIFIALRDTVQRFAIPIDPFRQLLQAFRADAEFQPFPTFAALRDYCRRSADPVGHLILYLFGYCDAQRQQLADQICTGLQLANFWQDVAVDAARGRIYVPEEDLARFGCAAAELAHGVQTPALQKLMAFEVERTRNMLTKGLALTAVVERRLAREVWLFASGGLEILRAIEAVDCDVFTRRPTVSKWTKTRLVLQALVRASLDNAPRDERRSSFKWTVQPFALSSRHFWAAYRRAFRGNRQTQTGTRFIVERVGASHVVSDLRAAYAYCQNITRRSSSNFYYAFRLLSAERRDALFAVYAFCRFVDDIADDAGRRDPAGLLGRWREELGRVYDGTPGHPISRALSDTVHRFPLAQQHFLDLIRGVEMDLTQRRYTTFDALYAYCYLVASTVGLLCIEIFGHRHPSARDYAVDLGVAFQLTNILRDVMEDGRRGRIYLPLEDLRRFDCTEAELLSSHYSPRLGALMAFECGRARAYYLRARGALAPEDRSSLAAAEAMRLIYERLLDRIEARHFDVFGPKVTLPPYQKLTLALAAWGRSQLAVLTS
jgi:phytoene synthase